MSIAPAFAKAPSTSKPVPILPARLPWVTALNDFEHEVWPALCFQAYDLHVFPRTDFDPQSQQLIPWKTFDGMSYETLKGALQGFWYSLQFGERCKTEMARTIRAEWTNEGHYFSNSSSNGNEPKIVYNSALIFQYQRKGSK